MLIEADAAESVASRRLAEPSGTIRFTCSIGMAQVLGDAVIARFLARYPRVEIAQHATNRFVDLVDEGFDLGLRGHTGPLPDTGLVQRAIAPVPWYLVAAPRYLGERGTPATPDELTGHAGLLLGGPTARARWRLHGGAAATEVGFAPRLRTDDMATLKAAAVAGLGVASLPAYVCRDELRRKRLRRLLPAWSTGDNRVSLLMPSRRGQLAAVRALADFIVAELPPLIAG